MWPIRRREFWLIEKDHSIPQVARLRRGRTSQWVSVSDRGIREWDHQADPGERRHETQHLSKIAPTLRVRVNPKSWRLRLENKPKIRSTLAEFLLPKKHRDRPLKSSVILICLVPFWVVNPSYASTRIPISYFFRIGHYSHRNVLLEHQDWSQIPLFMGWR